MEFPEGCRVRLTIEVVVVRDDGALLEVEIPTGNGDVERRLIQRAALESGEIIGGG